MSASLMQLRDNVGDRITDARDLPQAILRDQLFERGRQGHQVLSRARVGTRTVGISASECRALPEFVEQLRNFRCSKRRHRWLQADQATSQRLKAELVPLSAQAPIH